MKFVQLKIKIDLLQDSLSSSVDQKAPFDPVKIRIFLLVVITLLSLIGFSVYNMLGTEDSKSPLNNIINTQNNASPKKVTPKQITTKIASPEPTLADNKIHTEELNVIDTSLAPANDPNVTIATSYNEKLLAVNEVNNVAPSKSKTIETSTITPPIAKVAKKEPTTVNVTSTSLNNIEQKKPSLVEPNQVINNIITRAQLTSTIEAREPTNKIEVLSLQEHKKLYLFTEVRGKNNQKIVHRWIFKQKNIAEITLNIGSNQWRTYSSKNFDQTMLGQWSVQVIDEDNTILKTVMFDVSQ